MGSIYGDLPRPFTHARLLGLARYADFQDLHAGETRGVSARVLKRAKRMRVILALVDGAFLGMYLCLFALDPGVWQALMLLWNGGWIVLMSTVLFVPMNRMIRELETLAGVDLPAEP